MSVAIVIAISDTGAHTLPRSTHGAMKTDRKSICAPVFGRSDGSLPWQLPRDLRRFKRLTLGHPVIMGRATHEAMSAPLVGRTNIVLSRNRFYESEDVIVMHTLEDALEHAKTIDPNVFVIGGRDVVQQTLTIADLFYLTLVHGDVDGDLKLELDLSQWKIEEQADYSADNEHSHSYSFLKLMP